MPSMGKLGCIHSNIFWKFKPEWRVILHLPDDEEDIEFESQQLAQGVIVVEQSIAAEERINDFNQHSSSLEVADPEIADSTLIANDLNNSMLDD
ncbi:hypothetical protein A2U01_0070757, partial [Trifolium medium]|nr:hypothetical protein [Trifolium medium]